MQLAESVKSVIKRLNHRGFEAYAVGGCVRDFLMSVSSKDYDICTSALPKQILDCFKGEKTLKTGIKHGTVTVIIDKMPIEVTTFRVDGEYSDNRHPDSVSFTPSLEEDLCRRDFTVNAMAYNDLSGIIDPFGGKEDLKNSIIRAVGNPDERFREDSLRILRALRFSAVLGFEIEPSTSESILKNCRLIKNVSIERIAAEFNRLIVGENAVSVLRKYKSVIECFIPEIAPLFGFLQCNKYHHLDVYEHTLLALSNTPPELLLRISILLHDVAKPSMFTIDKDGVGHFLGHPHESAKQAEVILKRLKYSNDFIKKAIFLISEHDHNVKPTIKGIQQRAVSCGLPMLEKLLLVQRADALAHSPEHINPRTENCEKSLELLNGIKEKGLCCSLAQLNIKGDDLLSFELKTKRGIGRILNTLLFEVIDGKIENEKDALVVRANEIVKENPKL